ncbi:hypothetical protein NDU88_001779 [Pleurodeles waltl]|uniref:Uncharacterized protein n=1 Tax=Pleurodeles waltl TaxID=8319 RepID=A0AAV7M0L3_PLEWA|nr:hypothetical protein NDU88_001779 [Pleurodeles waltl]
MQNNTDSMHAGHPRERLAHRPLAARRVGRGLGRHGATDPGRIVGYGGCSCSLQLAARKKLCGLGNIDVPRDVVDGESYSEELNVCEVTSGVIQEYE